MTGYTKLFGSIVASTIWREDDKTRLVWITMLAIANKHGEVEASVPGLADLSRVTVDEARAAIVKLESPDPDSRSTEEEGRRIVKVQGGWRLVNHAKYRAKLSADERREYLAQKQRECRARQQVSTVVNSGQTSSTPSTQAEADPKAKSDSDPKASPAKDPTLPRKRGGVRKNGTLPLKCAAFEEFWKAYPKRKAIAHAEAAWTKHDCASKLPQILVAIRAAKISHDWTKDAGQFIPNPASWLNSRGWEDEVQGKRLYMPGMGQTAQPAEKKTYLPGMSNGWHDDDSNE